MMENFEKSLKSKLEQSVDLEPSPEFDKKIELLIAKSSAENTSAAFSIKKISWLPVATAAFFLLLLMTYSSNREATLEPLQAALNASVSLEQGINDIKKENIEPTVFIEINTLNHQISRLDLQLQTLLLENNNDSKILALLMQRVDKLQQLKELYLLDGSSYRI